MTAAATVTVEEARGLPAPLVLGLAIVGLFVLAALLAEYLVGTGGLGHLFSTSRSYFDVERAWGTALLATVVSVLTFVVARGVERRVTDRFS